MLKTAIPAFVFLLMFIIGASLSTEDFVRLKQNSRAMLIAIGGQFVLLPLIAWLLILGFEPNPTIAIGLMLIALTPGGAMSNYYSFVAKANAALSVSITAFSSILAAISLPLCLSLIFPTLFADIMVADQHIHVLAKKQALQLFLCLIVPIGLGMVLRRIAPTVMLRVLPTLEVAGSAMLLALLITIFMTFHTLIVSEFKSLFFLAISFTIVSMIAAMLITAGTALVDRAAVIIEFPVRNLALTSMVATSVFDNPEYMLFAAVFFVVQTPLMLAFIVWHRRQY
ncbi:Pantothenate precursors transporter PanS [BD1-7 clade bacterium]|uniref:Pantothenates transporter PanS n=1 Tax=BD1-7 clade bacterium TaxID=2029982 RepID=A0A5S9QQR7_9GAMM|nr:Pantothenate precursors transporter PanS [BD1-7 clade bacterium]CAA0121607.1 Pantothenate precursors transporter PanS [BD1-7 clade bacterium]